MATSSLDGVDASATMKRMLGKSMLFSKASHEGKSLMKSVCLVQKLRFVARRTPQSPFDTDSNNGDRRNGSGNGDDLRRGSAEEKKRRRVGEKWNIYYLLELVRAPRVSALAITLTDLSQDYDALVCQAWQSSRSLY
ncbi:hypothetical protein LTS01_007618 [Friedmanniomyces endolithicus]|nr:hypothetical protein LTS01_007618 [Friedmanniomyces endolithicus]